MTDPKAPLLTDEQLMDIVGDIAPSMNWEVCMERTAMVVRQIYEAQIARLTVERDKLREAAQAVVNRWDSPQWEWETNGHTGNLIATLRALLTPARTEPGSVEDAPQTPINTNDNG